MILVKAIHKGSTVLRTTHLVSMLSLLAFLNDNEVSRRHRRRHQPHPLQLQPWSAS